MIMLKDKRGLTLIEILLYVGIMATIVLVASALLALLLRAQIKNQTIAEVEQQGRYALSVITQAVRNAESVTSPTAGSTDSSLELSMLDASLDPTTFSVTSDTLYIQEGAASAVALTNSRVTISDLLFENVAATDAPDAVRVSFTLTYDSLSSRSEYTFSQTFYGGAVVRFAP